MMGVRKRLSALKLPLAHCFEPALAAALSSLVSYSTLGQLGCLVFKILWPLRNDKLSGFCCIRIDHFVAAVPNLAFARPSRDPLERWVELMTAFPRRMALRRRDRSSPSSSRPSTASWHRSYARRVVRPPVMMSSCQLGVAFAAPSNWIPSTPSTRLGSLARGGVSLLVL